MTDFSPLLPVFFPLSGSLFISGPLELPTGQLRMGFVICSMGTLVICVKLETQENFVLFLDFALLGELLLVFIVFRTSCIDIQSPLFSSHCAFVSPANS